MDEAHTAGGGRATAVTAALVPDLLLVLGLALVVVLLRSAATGAAPRHLDPLPPSTPAVTRTAAAPTADPAPDPAARPSFGLVAPLRDRLAVDTTVAPALALVTDPLAPVGEAVAPVVAGPVASVVAGVTGPVASVVASVLEPVTPVVAPVAELIVPVAAPVLDPLDRAAGADRTPSDVGLPPGGPGPVDGSAPAGDTLLEAAEGVVGTGPPPAVARTVTVPRPPPLAVIGAAPGARPAEPDPAAPRPISSVPGGGPTVESTGGALGVPVAGGHGLPALARGAPVHPSARQGSTLAHREPPFSPD